MGLLEILYVCPTVQIQDMFTIVRRRMLWFKGKDVTAIYLTLIDMADLR